MRRLGRPAVICLGGAFGWMSVALAQGGRGGADWNTIAGDAQRSSWVRTDPKISRDSLQKPGFGLTWKIRFDNATKQLNSLTEAVLLDRYIGYRGFRSLAFVGGSADKVFAVDTDLGRVEWQKAFSGAPQGGSMTCPGGMTAGVTRPAGTSFPSAMSGRGAGGGGRGGPAKSGVGQPGQGAVTLAEAGPPRPAAPVAPGAAGRGPGALGGRTASFVYALSSDGMLHSMYVSNGGEPEPAVKFLAANANAHGLTVVDNVAYAATTQGCGGVPDGISALDLASKQVAFWKSDAKTLGPQGPAFGPDGTLYITTGEGDYALVALEPKTLVMKNSYRAGPQGFTTSPVIFEYQTKVLIAAATKDGRIHLLDTASLGGSDHQTPLFKTPPDSNSADFGPAGLASWQDAAGLRWIAAPTAKSITAWQVVDRNGAPSLQPGWVSRDLASPLPPMVVNGIVFAVTSGEFRASDSQVTASQRAQRSAHAVLYALDAATGKELWNSGNTMTSFVHGSGLSGGSGQLYLGTYDGTLYAFGFPIEH